MAGEQLVVQDSSVKLIFRYDECLYDLQCRAIKYNVFLIICIIIPAAEKTPEEPHKVLIILQNVVILLML